MILSKFQYEWFLLEIFRNYNNEYNIVDVKKNESPDFICSDDNGEFIGLEITESMLQTYGRTRSIFKKYANRGLNIREIKQQIYSSKKDSCFLRHDKIIKIGEITCYSPTKGLIDTKVMRLEMTKDVEKKTIKLNQNYKVLNKNILMIAPSGCFLTSDEDHECFWQAKNHALRNLIFPAPCFHYWVFMVECVKR